MICFSTIGGVWTGEVETIVRLYLNDVVIIAGFEPETHK